jgi:hypothetical protein
MKKNRVKISGYIALAKALNLDSKKARRLKRIQSKNRPA